MQSPIENCLSDTTTLLIEEAKSAVENLRKIRSSGSHQDLDFESGRSFGLFQAVCLLHAQLLAFNIDPTQAGFPAGFDPENELIQ